MTFGFRKSETWPARPPAFYDAPGRSYELSRIYRFVSNPALYIADQAQYGVKDFPAAKLPGDCEDQALYAMAWLSERDWPLDAMRVITCGLRSADLFNHWRAHAWLGVRIETRGLQRLMILDPDRLTMQTVQLPDGELSATEIDLFLRLRLAQLRYDNAHPLFEGYRSAEADPPRPPVG